MSNGFMTIEMLGTFAGLVAAVSIIVQFTKSIVKNKFGDAYIRLYTLIIALILTFIFAKPGQGIKGIALTVVNSVVVSITSIGSYEVISDPKAMKRKYKD
ncbi:hypothetical protein [Proteiniborus sp. MB09-C3]|uniref:hypothetical protein n=1 Tax=Proteiniborus sp. MB09-C3 TaxID=3050072 RepID=UPI0025536B1D|nr:hypothetical protein [Proteiniborus sp. MB09-C3]WIV11866.1 hypothetical protein QO263_17455 [Proteiniborus sp. MB09-C3]